MIKWSQNYRENILKIKCCLFILYEYNINIRYINYLLKIVK